MKKTSIWSEGWMFLLLIPIMIALMFIAPTKSDESKQTTVRAAVTKNTQFWFSCQPSHALQDDPITHFGEPGVSHIHEFFGNTTTNANSTYESMVNQQTTCNVTNDSAAYWFPALIAPDGSRIAPKLINVYYWGLKGITQPFPLGFSFRAGASVGTPVSVPGHVYYSCTGPGGVDSDHLIDCDKQIKAQVEFPSCWDGTVAYDETPYVVYPLASGLCPQGYVTLPRLVEHIQWNYKTAGSAHLSSDTQFNTDQGRSLHADFINAWPQDVLERLVQNCLVLDQPCKDLRGPQ